jgi:spore germination cell wall hydrolase CwlJ-like protein
MRSKPVLISVFFSAIIVMLSCINIDTQKLLPLKTSYSQLAEPTKVQITCLAENIYFEAAHEPVEGWKAVAFVTVNRVQSGYGNTICSVVKQKTNGTCQFSWYCERITEKDLTIHDRRLYNEILELATNLVVNYEIMKDVTDGATYYHATYVQPGWTKLEKVKQIGNHIFYRSKKDSIDRNKEFI